jgi:hypothetical protein
MRAWTIPLTSLMMLAVGTARAADTPFARGLPTTPESFPIAVWLQSPANADRYRAIGIDIYVGL